MHVLVTGATGFIGRILVQLLLQHQIRVTVLVRENYRTQKPLPEPLNTLRPHFDVIYGDLQNSPLTCQALEAAAPSHVIHLAAAGVTTPFLPLETALRHNLDATLHLIRACFQNESAESKPRQLIIGRTPGERTAMNVYAASKAAAWQFCRMYAKTEGWPIHGAMIFQAYGPGQPPNNLIPAAITKARANQDFPMTNGKQARDWIYLDDIVQALYKTLGHPLPPGTTVEIGTGQAASVAEVVETIYRLTNSSGRPLIGHLPNRPGEDPLQTANAAAARQLIGWQAETTLEQGLGHLLKK